MGLFTEKSEVTINHRSNQELVSSLRAKIQKLMHPQGIEDAQTVQVNGETIDVSTEMGLDKKEEAPEKSENDDSDSDKRA